MVRKAGVGGTEAGTIASEPRVSTWAFGCATVVTLAAAGCGGGVAGGAAAGSDAGIVRAFWTDPQNPLEPANTNEVQGGKVLDMIFRGLKRYDPRTGKAQNAAGRRRSRARDSQNFTITVKSGWTFTNGEKVTAKSFVDAWNYGARLTNNQKNAYFFEYIDGYDKVHPGRRRADRQDALRAEGRQRHDLHRQAQAEVLHRSPTPSATPPSRRCPGRSSHDHAAWLRKPVGNGPYTVESYTKGSQMALRQWDGYPGPDKAQNGGVDLQGLHRQQHRLHRSARPATSTWSTMSPRASSRTSKSDLGDRYINSPAGIIQTLAFPFYAGVAAGEGQEGPHRALDGDQPRRRSPRRSSRSTRTPATDWTSPVLGKAGRLQGRACAGTPALRPGRRPRS